MSARLSLIERLGDLFTGKEEACLMERCAFLWAILYKSNHWTVGCNIKEVNYDGLLPADLWPFVVGHIEIIDDPLRL